MLEKNIIKIYLVLYLKTKFHSTLEQSILCIAYITVELHGCGSSVRRYVIVLQVRCLSHITLTFSFSSQK